MHAVERWNRLEGDRQATLERARLCSKLTIPGLLPPQGYTESQPLPTPYQSVGARGVNNIASKLLLSLLPPGQPPFRMQIEPKVLAELKARGQLTEVQKRLAEFEKIVTARIETLAIRPTLFEAIKHLVVAGNVLIKFENGKLRLYRLDQFVVRRAEDGSLKEVIIKTRVAPEDIPPSTLIAAKIDPTKKELIDVYTVIEWRADGRCYEWQEVNNVDVLDSHGHWPAEKCPWLVLRWTSVSSAHYGRGLCEEYLGDLLSLEGLEKAIVKFAAAASKIVFLTKAGAADLWKRINKAESGDAVSGNPDDVKVLQVEKFNDFQVAKATADGIETRLSNAFLLRNGTVRNAERVTAEEIRMIAQELEDVLGGTYTVLAVELQLPLIKAVVHSMTTAGELPALPKETATPVIVTGFEALGRNHEMNRLLLLLSTLVQYPMAQARINWGEASRRLGVSIGVEDIDTLLLSDEQVAQGEQSALAGEVLQRAAAPVAGAVAKAQLGQ